VKRNKSKGQIKYDTRKGGQFTYVFYYEDSPFCTLVANIHLFISSYLSISIVTLSDDLRSQLRESELSEPLSITAFDTTTHTAAGDLPNKGNEDDLIEINWRTYIAVSRAANYRVASGKQYNFSSPGTHLLHISSSYLMTNPAIGHSPDIASSSGRRARLLLTYCASHRTLVPPTCSW
jgi:hypothetical protein